MPWRPRLAGSRPLLYSFRGKAEMCDTAAPLLSGMRPRYVFCVEVRAARSSPLSGLVVTALVPADDVQAVVGVDQGDGAYQRGELIGVIVPGRVRPCLVGDTGGAVGDAGALLGKLERGPL